MLANSRSCLSHIERIELGLHWPCLALLRCLLVVIPSPKLSANQIRGTQWVSLIQLLSREYLISDHPPQPCSSSQNGGTQWEAILRLMDFELVIVCHQSCGTSRIWGTQMGAFKLMIA